MITFSMLKDQDFAKNAYQSIWAGKPYEPLAEIPDYICGKPIMRWRDLADLTLAVMFCECAKRGSATGDMQLDDAISQSCLQRGLARMPDASDYLKRFFNVIPREIDLRQWDDDNQPVELSENLKLSLEQASA